MIIESGSIDVQTRKRLEVLHIKHNDWLMACAYNQSKDIEVSKDLVQDLYLYLSEKNNPKLYYQDSFNLLYCHNFIKSRYINWIKRENKKTYISPTFDKEDDVYDEDWDNRLELTYQYLKDELDNLSKTKMWSSAKLYEMYAFSEITMEELSNKIGISKSTVFLNIKKIKEHIQNKIENPFKIKKDEL